MSTARATSVELPGGVMRLTLAARTKPTSRPAVVAGE